MLYLLFLLVIAFRDEELAYPWTYAAILGLAQVVMLKVFGTAWAASLAVGIGVYLYLGIVFLWLSRQTRYSVLWWLALFFATLPVTYQSIFRAFGVVHRS